jgi:hypothetical protein
MTEPYGDGETFEHGSAMFCASMKMCDDCSRTDQPLAWYGRNIRICEACRDYRFKKCVA